VAPEGTGSIGDGFIGTSSFWPHYGPGIDSACKKNEYEECFLGEKAVVA
jgi:hypothetical protein